MTERAAMTDDQIALSKSPTLASQMPVVFDNGARWNTLKTECAGCSDELTEHQINGRITRPLRQVYVVEGMGYCQFCDLWTPVFVRLREDMSFEMPKDGEWRRWQARHDGFFVRLKIWLQRRLGSRQQRQD